MTHTVNRYIITLLLAVFSLTALCASSRKIKRVEDVSVSVAVGNVPSLPWQVWVTYSDGTHEWRQVRWDNSAIDEEKRLADPHSTPVGTQYKVQGYILGDGTTAKGYPIEAQVSVCEDKSDGALASVKATPLPLNKVALIGDNRLTNNRKLDLRMLLSLDITQQLYNFRDTYGLPTEGYTVSNGWDSPTTKLKGHGSGHYMSALAHAYAGSSADEMITLADGREVNVRSELHARMQRMVRELRECQERTFVYSDSLGRYLEARDYAPEAELRQMKGLWTAFNEYKKGFSHYGYGYLNAIPAAHPALIECYRAYNNEEWVWAPYYTIHKILAGLIDIADVTQDKTALRTATDMGLWVWNRLHYRTFCQQDGTREQRRSKPGNRYEMWNMYIAGEVGGMAESLSRLAEMTDSKEEAVKLIEAASYFDAPAFFNPVARNIDDIRTRHANQHIPMIIGALRSYRTNHNPYYYDLSINFWNLIQGRYTYAMGGVGNGEMWRQPYTQMANMNTSVMTDNRGNRIANPDMNETCCAYNLAKLTKELNSFNPGDARFMDYYERLLYNQIVGSVHPDNYGVCYQYAVGLNARKPFGNVTPQESCCGGTGAENHVKYQDAAYWTERVSDGKNALIVALYLPTQAKWGNVTVRQECEWPAEFSRISFGMDKAGASDRRFAVKFRVPYWATNGFDIKLNGKSIAAQYTPCSYIEIPEREWNSSDVVEVSMPFTKHICYGADKMDMAFTDGQLTPFASQWVGTLMYGPLVMTSPDIHSWDEASLSLSSLDDVALSGTHPYTLTANGKRFVPDYIVADEHTTHYVRLDLPTGKKKGASSRKLDLTELNRMVSQAKERAASDWAPNGYRRLQERIADAEGLAAKCSEKKSVVKQSEIDYATSALNVAFISMRPANLAEPEDLTELISLMERTRPQAASSPELRNALNYARTVVRYVNDGSGTKDMINKAISRLSVF